jgi:hypothetical protein
MKNTNKVSKMPVFGLAVIAAVALTLALTACDILNNSDDGDGDGKTFTSLQAYREWYEKQPDNTPDTPYRVTLNFKETNFSFSGGNFNLTHSSNSKKYIFLDVSGSPFTKISSGNTGDFEDCKNLVGIIIPNTVTSIGDETGLGHGAFQGCANLTSVTLPTNAAFTSINQNTFSGCAKLTGITIPNSVTRIGGWAFNGCTSLTSVTIPNSVNSIEQSAFRDCAGLTSVTIPNGITDIGPSAFRNCAGLTGITIPNSVTTIGAFAFNGCTGLTSVIIPSSVTSIKAGAFGSTSLTSVTFEGTISSSDFQHQNVDSNSESFPGDLRNKYLDEEDGGKGTYTRESGGNTWTKQ